MRCDRSHGEVLLAVAQNDDEGVVVGADGFWCVGLHGDGVIGTVTRSSSR